jgi:hypothetical protein
MPVPAGIIRNPNRSTLVALIQMTPQFCSTANLDHPHDTEVTKGHFMTVSLSIRWPKSPKDIGNL